MSLRAARVLIEFHQHGRAAYFTEAATCARRRFVERDKLLAGEKAKVVGGDPRWRTEWRTMRLPSLPAMAMAWQCARLAGGFRQRFGATIEQYQCGTFGRKKLRGA